MITGALHLRAKRRRFTRYASMPPIRQLRYITSVDRMFQRMLAQVRRVPRGKVATYGDIAYAAGFPGAARQVAWALHGSSQGLPWHRKIGRAHV